MAKELQWVGRSLEEIRAFPDEARREAGHQLFLVQLGEEPDDWKPMPGVGRGVMELRIHGDTEHRVFYVAKFAEAVYVLHAFEKKQQKTPAIYIKLGQERLKEVLRWRREQRK